MEGAALSAAEALKAARAVGMEFHLDGDDLMLEAPAPPPAAILDLLSRRKAGIVVLLRPGRDGWSAEDWQMFFDERAGITEFDGGLTRGEAEARAFDCCVAEWLNRNPVRSPPGRCLGCGEAERARDPLLPFGTEPTGHAWVHSCCRFAWYAGRKAEAAVALSRRRRRTGGWDRNNFEEQPHAKQIAYAPEPALHCPDEGGDAVPVARDGERALPDARRRVARGAEGK